MRALVTGASGFVGSHLRASLAKDGHDVFGTSTSEHDDALVADVRDAAAVEKAVVHAAPDRIFHLAAQSSAALSWTDPGLTYDVNVMGTHNVLEAVRRQCPGCRVLLSCTSDEYGIVDPDECPIDETTSLRPVSPYATSKVAQEWVGRMFAEAFGLQVVITRAFMHIGPGQPASFATAEWARRIALAEAGLSEAVVTVGDLDLAREFGDVRDVVRAYRAVLDSGAPGEVYNVATGEARTLGDALDVLVGLSAVEMEVRVDPSKIRPADPPLLVGTSTKLTARTGWKPQHTLEDTLATVLEHWRAEVARETTTSSGK